MPASVARVQRRELRCHSTELRYASCQTAQKARSVQSRGFVFAFVLELQGESRRTFST
jgi:hypothetical protein